MTRTSADISSDENDKVSVSPLSRFARKAVVILLSSLLVFQPLIANAQFVSASGTAPVANQPGVGSAPNGVPLVDIVTPKLQSRSYWFRRSSEKTLVNTPSCPEAWSNHYLLACLLQMN
ncbi:hypothetical protein [Rhizobium sp.]|uniref:hypothetical protein n=1 Tax=Rhizobium sp. TaxID=391 RepID=UPI002F16E424